MNVRDINERNIQRCFAEPLVVLEHFKIPSIVPCTFSTNYISTNGTITCTSYTSCYNDSSPIATSKYFTLQTRHSEH